MNRSGRGLYGGSLVVALALAGCATFDPNTAVDDTWVARVPQEDLRELNQARANEVAAKDEVMRAQVRQQDAEREVEVAQRKVDAAAAQVKAVGAALAAAQATGQGSQIRRQERALSEANAALDAANEEVAYRSAVADQWQATVAYRQQVVQASEARTALQKLRAVKQSGDVRAQQLEERDFTAAIGKADQGVAAARSQLERAAQQAEAARARWQRSVRPAGELPQS